MKSRLDMSKWVIHFIHDRNPENDYRYWFEDYVQAPVGIENGRFVYSDWWDLCDSEYSIDSDAKAFSVLCKILFDGHIRAGWSFRNQKATIYGPYPAVCFTEMPLYALIEYAKLRTSDNVNNYGIALLKDELFEAGGRPVIYGLTGPHIEAKDGDPLFGQGFRNLASNCGLGIKEQYRYVATKLSKDKTIDWTHEREWRWAYSDRSFDIPGLPIWLEDGYKFSKILVITQKTEEAETFLNRLKEYRDSGINDYCIEFNKETLENTAVLALDELNTLANDMSITRIDDLPLKSLPKISTPAVTQELLKKVSMAVDEARISAILAAESGRKGAIRDEKGRIKGLFGFASVNTDQSHSEVTQALIQLGYAKAIGGLGYRVEGLLNGVNTEMMIDIEEAAAEAAAEKLFEMLGQVFYVRSRLD